MHLLAAIQFFLCKYLKRHWIFTQSGNATVFEASNYLLLSSKCNRLDLFPLEIIIGVALIFSGLYSIDQAVK